MPGQSIMAVLRGLVLAAGVLAGACPGWAQTSADIPDRLTVATIERPPFSIRTENGYSGFSIDLWNALSRELGFSYEFVSASTFPEMLEKVRNGEADAAIANISITSSRELVLDFSQPIFDSGLHILVREDSDSNDLVSAIFTWDMFSWLAGALLVLFAIANLMWFFERRAQEYFQHPYREGIWRSFWWALNVVVNGGFEERIPRSRPGKLFAVCLVVASLFIVSIFVAKITSALTIGELRSHIQGFNDLYGKQVGTTARSTSADFLKSKSIRFREFENIEALFKALEDNELDAVVHDAPILAYYAATTGKGIVMTAGAVFRPEKYGIALPQGSPLREPLDRALLKLREDGTHATLVEKYFGENYP